jgi:hypothetical protein
MEECMGQPDDMFYDEEYPAYTMGRAACRIIILEDQLEEALRQNESEKVR